MFAVYCVNPCLELNPLCFTLALLTFVVRSTVKVLNHTT